jgi:arylsulfatase
MPRHDQPFDGVIARTVQESTPAWPRLPQPPEGAPNVVVIVLDDVGFAHLGCYGSEIETPNMDRLAARGLRYNNFHTTALCSPTRACLLTGRNHHMVGVASVMEMGTGFPGYDMQVPKSAGTIAQVLRANGYNTFAVGKWHLAPGWELTPVGPYDHWPLGMGFERFYGFMGGETDQYGPSLVHDNHRVEPPKSAAEGYHLSEDIVDKAIQFVTDVDAVAPAKPFFLYCAFGACHAPHQAPAEFIEKYKGRFDKGWDVVREETLARQLESGIVPPGTELAPPNPGVKAWDELSDDHRRLFARMQEVFAGFLDHTDVQIGRLLDFIESIGRLDDTVVVLISDNGASQEGGARGSTNEMKFFNLVPESTAELMEAIDRLGSPFANNHYPWGWAQAGNTPLKRYKQNTHGGGIRDPLIISWPAGITDVGTVRTQYHHVSDLMPTLLDVIGIDAPEELAGITQQRIDGTSLAYTFADAGAPTRKVAQYYEMIGNRAIWSGGWKAVAWHAYETPIDSDEWELYHIDEDFSECHDLAADQPDKLREMIDLWWAEAGRNNVLPVDGRTLGRFTEPKPHAAPSRSRYRYLPGTTTLPEGATHDVRNRNHTITARVVIPDGGAEGVLFAQAGRFAGFALFVQDGRLVYDHNYLGTHYRVTAESDLTPGEHTLQFAFTSTGHHQGDGGLFVDGTEVGRGEIPHTVPGRYAADEGFDVGRDTGTPVADTYESPFPFTGKLLDVVIETEGQPFSSPAYDFESAMRAQ